MTEEFQYDPEIPLDVDEWKLLFMLIGENRGNLNFYASGLTPHGISLLDSVRDKLGRIVVGVGTHKDPTTVDEPVLCNTCGQPLVFTLKEEGAGHI